MRCWRSYGGARFELHASRPLIRQAQRWLGSHGWRSDPSPPGTARIVLQAQGSALRCAAPALTGDITGTPADVLDELEYSCTSDALKRSRSAAAIHAALVTSREHSVLLVGAHASGKTTLGLALSELGLDLHGDDVVFINGDGRARALPRPLRVRTPSLRLLRSLGPSLRRHGVYDRGQSLYRVDLRRLGMQPSAPRRVRDVVFARYSPTHTGADEPTRLSPRQAIPRALNQTFSVRPRDTRTADSVISVLRRARIWTMTYSCTPRRAAARLVDQLG